MILITRCVFPACLPNFFIAVFNSSALNFPTPNRKRRIPKVGSRPVAAASSPLDPLPNHADLAAPASLRSEPARSTRHGTSSPRLRPHRFFQLSHRLSVWTAAPVSQRFALSTLSHSSDALVFFIDPCASLSLTLTLTLRAPPHYQ